MKIGGGRAPRGYRLLALLCWTWSASVFGGGCTGADAGAFSFTDQVELALIDAPSNVLPGGAVALRGDGQLIALTPSPMGATEMVMFSGDGAFDRTIGSPGEGPGEYRWISALAFDAGDSLWVFDSGNRRADIYGPDLTLARSSPMDGWVQVAAPSDGGGIVVIARLDGGGGSSVRVERMRQAERDVVFEVRAAGEDRGPQLLATSGDAVFLAPRQRYSVRRVESDGEVVAVIEPEPDWWVAPSGIPEELGGIMAVGPSLLSMVARDDGLWILAGLVEPPANALTVVQDPTLSPQQIAAEVASWTRNVIHVVDPSSGALRREMTLPGVPVYFLDDEFGYRWMPGEPGDLTDWQLTVGRYGPGDG